MNGHNGQTPGQPLFPRAWWAFDLGRYRGCDGTYCYYEYDSLPPITAPSESLDWLEPLDAHTDAQMAMHRNPPEARGEVAKMAASATRLGLTLPESFVRLMSDPTLQDSIPSCTACYFKLSDDLLPFPGGDGGYFTRFLNDQQDVLLWYLYLMQDGAQSVLVTPIELEEMARQVENGTFGDDERQAIRSNTWVCAPSFGEFVYRWWLENSIWFKVSESNDEEKLTGAERAYLAQYDAHNTHPDSSH
jgi:hypothetical protein